MVEKTVEELKAEWYDKFVEYRNAEIRMQELAKQLNVINEEIEKKKKNSWTDGSKRWVLVGFEAQGGKCNAKIQENARYNDSQKSNRDTWYDK